MLAQQYGCNGRQCHVNQSVASVVCQTKHPRASQKQLHLSISTQTRRSSPVPRPWTAPHTSAARQHPPIRSLLSVITCNCELGICSNNTSKQHVQSHKHGSGQCLKHARHASTLNIAVLCRPTMRSHMLLMCMRCTYGPCSGVSDRSSPTQGQSVASWHP